VRADADELVYRAHRAEHRPLFDRDVPGESRAVDEHRVVTDHRVVADVRVGHDERMVPDPGRPATLLCAERNGHTLADQVVVADLDGGGVFFPEGPVLRLGADDGEGIDLVVLADAGDAVHDDVRDQLAAFADLDAIADHAIGADAHARV
jgi:hypothetical protein